MNLPYSKKLVCNQPTFNIKISEYESFYFIYLCMLNFKLLLECTTFLVNYVRQFTLFSIPFILGASFYFRIVRVNKYYIFLFIICVSMSK